MFTRILVPLDGSPMSEAAVRAAEALARTFGSEISLLYINEPNAPRRVHGQHHLQTAAEASRYLEQLAGAVSRREIRINWHVHEPRERNVAEGIALHVRELAPDLIVACSHGSSSSTRLFIGSIAQRVASSTSAPVFMVRPDWDPPQSGLPCEGVLVPLDGQPDHEAGLSIAQDFAVHFSVPLRLLLIVPTYGTAAGRSATISRFLPGATMRMLELEAGSGETYIVDKARELGESGLEVTWDVLRGNPSREIIRTTKNHPREIVVLATHGHEGFNAFWNGSVAHRICSFSRVPVLLVPVAQAERATGT